MTTVGSYDVREAAAAAAAAPLGVRTE